MSGEVLRGRILTGQYQDSVWLMRANEALRTRDGVEAVGVVMGTPRNLEMLEQSELLFDGCREQATANDIVIAVRGEAEAVEAALEVAPEAVSKPSGSSPAKSYSSLGGALAAAAGSAPLALVSVNGRYAAKEARDALEAGLDVMIFSDNVSVAEEIELKRRAAELGRIVMGPDCGTAIVNGVGLGFANEVPLGPVGIVAASGTGAQAVSTLLAARGVGVSQLVGLGGRDLGDEVGGLSLAAALAALDADQRTEVIVLVAKKTGGRVLADLVGRIGSLSKPLVACLLGPGSWWVLELAGGHTASSLDGAAAVAAALAAGGPRGESVVDTAQVESWREKIGKGRSLQGRFAGGTLAQEALDVATALLGPVRSNLGSEEAAGNGHQILDLGDDEYTTNAPHPMINPAQQAEELRAALAIGSTGAVVFDIVIGHGSHDDPASVLAPAIAEGLASAAGEGRATLAVCSVCGTEADPQRRAEQVARIGEAGAIVMPTNAAAAMLAALAVAPASAGTEQPAPEFLSRPLRAVVNVGSSWFADAIAAQDVDVFHVDWRPPAGGDEELASLLDALG